MNKSYVYIDGKVILENKKGKKYAQNVCNNTYDIVKQENLIETIDDNIKDIEEEKENTKLDKVFYRTMKMLSILAVFLPIISALIGTILFYKPNSLLVNDIFIFNQNDLIITNILKFFNISHINETIYYSLNCIFSLGSMIIVPIGIIFGTATQILYKKKQKEVLEERAGYDKVLEYLKARKLNEEETLAKLKAESIELVNEQEKGFKNIEVDENYQEELNNNIDKAYDEGISLSRKRRR